MPRWPLTKSGHRLRRPPLLGFPESLGSLFAARDPHPDFLRYAGAQIVDRHVARPFRVKKRRLLRPLMDFRQLAHLPRRKADVIVAPRAIAAGGINPPAGSDEPAEIP